MMDTLKQFLVMNMPEGPLGAPRLTNIGPLSRSTEDEIRKQWDECSESGKESKICKEIKRIAISILENQGFFAECKTLVDINSGNCANVAERVFENIDNTRVIEAGDGDHVWIKYKGVHYDAEVPTGVNDALKLPFFARIPPESLLRNARMAAEAEGREPPETIEDTIEDITDSI